MSGKNLKSLWHFNRGERAGIISLLVAIAILLMMLVYWDIPKESAFKYSSPEIVKLQREWDSLKCIAQERKKPKIFPFNPNFLSDYKAYTFGMTPQEYDRLKDFREQGKWINSVADFKRVTQVPDSVLGTMSPYFKFPDWIKNPKKYKRRSYAKAEAFTGKKLDLNTATQEQLQAVSGIGEVFSQRIIEKRNQLDGFDHEFQLYDVWGIKPEVIQRALQRFEVKNPRPIVKMNLNKASASDLSTIPGISFGLAKKIWEFVYLREGISEFEELTKIEELTPQKLQLIQLYLLIE